MAESTEYDFPGTKVTGRAHGAAVLGMRLVTLQDAVATDGLRPVAYPAAGGQAHYLARNDALQDATISMVRCGAFTVEAGAAITAPAALMATATGKVITAAGLAHHIVGYAMTDAAADGDPVVVDLLLPGYFVA